MMLISAVIIAIMLLSGLAFFRRIERSVVDRI
jgi:hypothetical protein